MLKENKNGEARALRFMGAPPRISDFSIWVIWKMAEIANPFYFQMEAEKLKKT
ncbi:MAG: hypothetical protein MUF75_11455 [Bacteroidia bacterium]|nr:hypothetical protein [Bacteroidia bacterium]